jgi:hypothetical protein
LEDGLDIGLMMAWTSVSSCIAACLARFLADLVSRSDTVAMDSGGGGVLRRDDGGDGLRLFPRQTPEGGTRSEMLEKLQLRKVLFLQ